MCKGLFDKIFFRVRKKPTEEEVLKNSIPRVNSYGMTQHEEYMLLTEAITSGRVVLDQKEPDPCPVCIERDSSDGSESKGVITGNMLMLDIVYNPGDLVRMRTDLSGDYVYMVVGYMIEGESGHLKYQCSNAIRGEIDLPALEITKFIPGYHV